MAPFKAHSVRFYDLDPVAIQCLALNEGNDSLAVSRSDSSVEVWSVTHTPFMLKHIPGSPEGSVESLCWYEERLFSCGLHGFVLEYDLNKLTVKGQYAVTSGPAWCIASNRTNNMIASGTEEGFVCVFRVLSDTLEYLRILDKQEGRILCLCWNPQGTHLATGSIDTIRVWDANTGHPTARMTTGRVEKNKETIVWSVVVTEDMTVISGDSRGRTSFWNGRNGTLIDSIQSHKADVLTVNLNPNGTTAYSSGIDPTIMHFQLISKADGRRRWVKSLHRVVNTHDVRALVSHKDRIYSGGVDSYLTISNFVGKSVVRVPPVPRQGVSQVAGEAGVLLLKYSTYLEVWRLGETEVKSGMVNSNLPLCREPLKLLQLHTKDNEYILCSTISRDGKWLAYATQTRLRVYRLDGCEDDISESVSPSLSRIKLTDNITDTPLQLAFFKGKDGEVCLMSGTQSGNIQVYSLTSGCMYSSWSLLCNELQLRSAVNQLAVTDRCAVISDFSGNIVALDLGKEKLVSVLPSYKESTLTTLAISPHGKTCIMVYSNQRVVEVDLKTSRFTAFSNGFNQKLHKDWTNRKMPITGACFVSPDVILLHDDEYLAIIDKDKDIQEPESKLQIVDSIFHQDESQDGSYISSSPSSSIHSKAVSVNCLRLMKKFHHLVGVHHLQDNAIVCVEIKPNQIEEKLPPSLRVKKYGAH